MCIKTIYYLICLLFLLNSCVDQRTESIRKAREEMEKYKASFPKSYREIIRRYEKNEIPIIEKSIQIRGGIFCLVNGIYSWKSFNERYDKRR